MNRNNIFIKILFITSFAMILAIVSNHNQTFALTYKKGDVLTTRSTSASGLTGHNGIYIGNGKVLDTPRVHHYPRVMSVKKWIKSYPKTTPLNILKAKKYHIRLHQILKISKKPIAAK